MGCIWWQFPQNTLKKNSKIYTPKWDDKHPYPFQMLVLPGEGVGHSFLPGGVDGYNKQSSSSLFGKVSS